MSHVPSTLAVGACLGLDGRRWVGLTCFRVMSCLVASSRSCTVAVSFSAREISTRIVRSRYVRVGGVGIGLAVRHAGGDAVHYSDRFRLAGD